MTTITTIGLDLAKKVFQVHGVDAEDRVVVARKLRRKEVLAFKKTGRIAWAIIATAASTTPAMAPLLSRRGVRGRRISGLAMG